MILSHSLVVAVQLIAASASGGSSGANKAIRVEHGRPVILVSHNTVLTLEFLSQSSEKVLIPHPEGDVRECRAEYRFRLFLVSSGAVTNGVGRVSEVYETVARGPGGNQVRNMGSQVAIDVGEFHLSWSEATAGVRSWLYYRTDSPVRFLEQPEAVAFDSIGLAEMRRYHSSQNVHEFVSASRQVRVLGPAEFSGDLPTEVRTSAGLVGGGIRDGVFVLRLENLSAGRHYVVESSLSLGRGGWTPIHTLVATEPNAEWSDPLGPEDACLFYRIREAPF